MKSTIVITSFISLMIGVSSAGPAILKEKRLASDVRLLLSTTYHTTPICICFDFISSQSLYLENESVSFSTRLHDGSVPRKTTAALALRLLATGNSAIYQHLSTVGFRSGVVLDTTSRELNVYALPCLYPAWIMSIFKRALIYIIH